MRVIIEGRIGIQCRFLKYPEFFSCSQSGNLYRRTWETASAVTAAHKNIYYFWLTARLSLVKYEQTDTKLSEVINYNHLRALQI